MSKLGGYGPRQIRETLRGHVDPRVGAVLVSLAERQEHLAHNLLALAAAFDKLASSLMVHSAVLERIKQGDTQYKDAHRVGVRVASEAVQDNDENK